MATTQPSPGPSALERASRIKKDQGFHECEVSVRTGATAAEADLHKHHIMCTKNPGHKAFIPVNKFKMEHLPERYRDNDILNFIRAIINLTVRVCVRFTSFDRVETFPGTGEPYPFYNNRGSNWLRTGTGMVGGVDSYTDENKIKEGKEGETCPCEPCKHSPTPMTQWYMIIIQTARHVVFDKSEAKRTTCQLFYDSEEEKDKIVELKGETMGIVEFIEHDSCLMYCYTHDLELGKRLEKMRIVYLDLINKVINKWKNCVIEHPLTVIVSHPHGCSKQVTVGEMKHREVMGKGRHVEKVDSLCTEVWVFDVTRYIFTTQTCPGSSGAPVFVLRKDEWLCLHPHSQRCEEDGLNKSAVLSEFKSISTHSTT